MYRGYPRKVTFLNGFYAKRQMTSKKWTSKFPVSRVGMFFSLSEKSYDFGVKKRDFWSFLVDFHRF